MVPASAIADDDRDRTWCHLSGSKGNARLHLGADWLKASDGARQPACFGLHLVERSFARLSCYRRLNTIFERSKDHLIAFVTIAFISILARRLKRLVAEELSA